MNLPWFRAYADMVDNEKVRLLSFDDRWHFVAILCCKAQGILERHGQMTRRKVAVKLGVDLQTLDEIVRRLSEVGLIDAKNFEPTGWKKRQFVSDNSTKRVRKHRKTKGTGNVSETFQKQDFAVTVTPPDPDPDPDPEAEPEKEKTQRGKSCSGPKAAAAPAPDPGTGLALVNGSKEVATKPLNGKIKAEAKTGAIWAAYSAAYFARYGAEPVRNAKINGQLAQIIDRLGADEAPHVAACYVGSSNAFYVARRHSVDCLLRDCESLRTEWATGTRITATEARQMDQHEAGAEAARWVTENKEMLRQMRREGKI